MSIRIGIYDFFAYTIPGGLLLLLLFYGMDSFGVAGIWEKLNALTTPQIFLLVVGAYLVGFIFNPFATKWSSWFESRNFEQDILDRIKKRNPALPVDIEAKDWAIWFASIRRENLELALEIDRYMAVAKMLRGVSLFLVLAGVMVLLNIIGQKHPAWYLVGVALSFLFSFVVMRESVYSKGRFFYSIFETVIARQKPFAATPKTEKETPAPENQESRK